MKTFLIIGGIIGGGFLLMGAIAAFVIWGMYDTQADLKTRYEAKVSANQAVFDNMFKKIDQTSQVTQAQKNALKEIIGAYVQGRNNGGGSLATSVREAVPKIDVSIFKQLMNIITGSRDEWTANQVALVDISREYNQNLNRASGFILKMLGFQPIVPKVITSDRTEKAFETGKDNSTELPIK